MRGDAELDRKKLESVRTTRENRWFEINRVGRRESENQTLENRTRKISSRNAIVATWSREIVPVNE